MSWTFEVSHSACGLDIRRHRLHNGLGLIVMADPHAPVVSYQTWYGVGSRHEQAGQTGMAHLFEHLMFNRTEKHGRGQFDRIIERTGGDNNAATWVDWTYYRDSVPPRDLATVVELEADRMANLVLESPELESEREVVANERMQRVDDDIDGFADEELGRLAYTIHPYRWPTIGWMEDIRSMTLDQVRSFYRTYYAPNNATVVVVGGVDEAAVLDLVASHYGSLDAADIPVHPTITEPAQTEERRRSFAKPTPSPRYLAGFRGVALGHPDWPALSLACAILGAGQSSRLYRRLVVESEIAIHVHCDVPQFRDPALIRISTQLRRGHRPDQAEAEIDSVLAQLQGELISEEELTKVRNVAETDFWSELEGCDGRAESLGHFQTTLGDFRRLFEIADSLSRVSREDIQRVARAHFGRHNRSVIEILPDGDEE